MRTLKSSLHTPKSGLKTYACRSTFVVLLASSLCGSAQQPAHPDFSSIDRIMAAALRDA